MPQRKAPLKNLGAVNATCIMGEIVFGLIIAWSMGIAIALIITIENVEIRNKK